MMRNLIKKILKESEFDWIKDEDPLTQSAYYIDVEGLSIDDRIKIQEMLLERGFHWSNESREVNTTHLTSMKGYAIHYGRRIYFSLGGYDPSIRWLKYLTYEEFLKLINQDINESEDFGWIGDIPQSPNYEGHPQGVTYVYSHEEIDEFMELLIKYNESIGAEDPNPCKGDCGEYHDALEDRRDELEWMSQEDGVYYGEAMLALSFFIESKFPNKLSTGYWNYEVDRDDVQEWLGFGGTHNTDYQIYQRLSDMKALFSGVIKESEDLDWIGEVPDKPLNLKCDDLEPGMMVLLRRVKPKDWFEDEDDDYSWEKSVYNYSEIVEYMGQNNGVVTVKFNDRKYTEAGNSTFTHNGGFTEEECNQQCIYINCDQINNGEFILTPTNLPRGNSRKTVHSTNKDKWHKRLMKKLGLSESEDFGWMRDTTPITKGRHYIDVRGLSMKEKVNVQKIILDLGFKWSTGRDFVRHNLATSNVMGYIIDNDFKRLFWSPAKYEGSRPTNLKFLKNKDEHYMTYNDFITITKSLKESNDFDWVKDVAPNTKILVTLPDDTYTTKREAVNKLYSMGYEWISNRNIPYDEVLGLLINVKTKKLIRFITPYHVGIGLTLNDPNANMLRTRELLDTIPRYSIDDLPEFV